MEPGNGSIGSARGRIVIDVASVKQAVTTTQQAAREIKDNLAAINQGIVAQQQQILKTQQAAARQQVRAAEQAAKAQLEGLQQVARAEAEFERVRQQRAQQAAREAQQASRQRVQEAIRENQQKAAFIRDQEQAKIQQRNQREFPAFLQFGFYPGMALAQAAGMKDLSNALMASSGFVGIVEQIAVTKSGIVTLAEQLKDMNGIFGETARGAAAAASGLNATAAAGVTVGAVLLPVIAVAIAFSVAISQVQAYLENAHKAAEAFTDGLKAQAKATQESTQAILSQTQAQNQTEIAKLQAANRGLQSGLGLTQLARERFAASANPIWAQPYLDTLDAQIKTFQEQIDANAKEIQRRQREVAEGIETLGRIRAPMEQGSQTRAILRRTAEATREQLSTLKAEFRETTGSFALSIIEYTNAVLQGKTAIADAILQEQIRLQGLMDEKQAAIDLREQLLPLINLRETAGNLLEQAQQGVKDFFGIAIDAGKETAERMREEVLRSIRQPMADRDIRRDILGGSAKAGLQARREAEEDLLDLNTSLKLTQKELNDALKAGDDELYQRLLGEKQHTEQLIAEKQHYLALSSAILPVVQFRENAVKFFKDIAEGITELVENAQALQTKRLDALMGMRQQWSQLAREGTVDQVTDRIQALQDERAAILSILPEMSVLARTSTEAAQRVAELRQRLGLISEDLSTTIGDILPQAIARAQTALAAEIAGIEANRSRELSELEADAADQRNQNARDAEDERNEIEENAEKERQRIVRRYALQMNNAIAERDALAFFQAKQARQEDLRNLDEATQERLDKVEEELDKQNRLIEDRLEQQTRTINEKYDAQLQKARDSAQQQIALAQQLAAAEISLRQQANTQMQQITAAGMTGIAATIQSGMNQANTIVVDSFNWLLDQARARVQALQEFYDSNQSTGTISQQQGYTIAQYDTGTARVPATAAYGLHAGESVNDRRTSRYLRYMLGENYTQSQLAAAVASGARGGGGMQFASSNAIQINTADEEGIIQRAVDAYEASLRRDLAPALQRLRRQQV